MTLDVLSNIQIYECQISCFKPIQAVLVGSPGESASWQS